MLPTAPAMQLCHRQLKTDFPLGLNVCDCVNVKQGDADQ